MKSIKEDCLCLDIASKVLVDHQEELSAVQNVVTRVIIITMMNNNEVHAYIGVAKVWSRVKSARSLPGHARACSRLCQWLREVCTITLLQQPNKLGGQGVVVQNDELTFKHKPKV